MNIYETKDRNPQLIEQLMAIWEDSVRATHLFLSRDEVKRIKTYVPKFICTVSHLVVAERKTLCPIAFMGIENKRLEMLFISPQERGKGLGRELIEYGISNYGIQEVTVNEQNPQAVGFYQHMGFETYKRTDYDEEGNPYPLLYMRLNRTLKIPPR